MKLRDVLLDVINPVSLQNINPVSEHSEMKRCTYFCHSKPDGLKMYGAKSQDNARNQLLKLSRR